MMSNGAPSADAKSGDGRAKRDVGRDHAMSRGGMSCGGATSVGKASNGRTMTGGMTSGAATTIGAEANASAMTGATTDAARGSLSTVVAGWDRRCTGPPGLAPQPLTQKHNHGPKTHKLRQSRKG